MKTANSHIRPASLPSFLKPFFWDTGFSRLKWNCHRDFIIQRILAEGDWKAVQWLRRKIGNEALRAWLLQHQGRGLDKRRLRFWELILPLPHKIVNAWLKSLQSESWEER
ncbi:MAG: hypothetical protein ONB46_22170 [candidate division KSB1 bacterium]|nr:hypothetical protein [candidate division KSB1 bacterium]MDZ7367727.1 hypothetical protein [candidate division KSB1 bacterium]MDZ7406307.1 hypothetical protein [candidate division KSB1 bacterium]